MEISKRNEEIQPVPLDGVERHTYPQGTGAPPCPSTTRREWRYRVGDYRIICDIRDSELIILALSMGAQKYHLSDMTCFRKGDRL